MTTTDLMREYLACARSGDWERGYAFYADDVRFHIPGRSGYAGERSGRDAARAYIEHARALGRRSSSWTCSRARPGSR